MTLTTFRSAIVGDIHHNITNLDKVKAFVLDMKSKNKVDIFMSVGDLVASSSNAIEFSDVKARFDALATAGVPYRVASGNHDASGSNCYTNCSDSIPTRVASCGFKTAFGFYPDQYPLTTNFTKGGITFQILIPGICWSTNAYWKYNFADPSISTTNPTIILNHGPIICCNGLKPSGSPCGGSNLGASCGTQYGCNCGSWDCLHSYGTGLRPQVNGLKLLASFSGHVHGATQARETVAYITNGILYVTQDTITTSSRCIPDTHNKIGYCKITYDSITSKYTVDYQNMAYMDTSGIQQTFVDPFPDTGGCPSLSCSLTGCPTTSILPTTSIQLTLTPTGGQLPYTYSWTLDGSPISGATTQAITVSNLSVGTHNIIGTVTDSCTTPSVQSCSKTCVVTVTQLPGCPALAGNLRIV